MKLVTRNYESPKQGRKDGGEEKEWWGVRDKFPLQQKVSGPMRREQGAGMESGDNAKRRRRREKEEERERDGESSLSVYLSLLLWKATGGGQGKVQVRGREVVQGAEEAEQVER